MQSDFSKRTITFLIFLFTTCSLPYIRTFIKVTVVTLNSVSPLDLGLLYPEFSLQMDFSLLVRLVFLIALCPCAVLVTVWHREYKDKYGACPLGHHNLPGGNYCSNDFQNSFLLETMLTVCQETLEDNSPVPTWQVFSFV